MLSGFIMHNSQFIELVESYNTIAVFRHLNPDGDALGSQLGMVMALKKRYPEKTVYLMGNDDHNFTIYQAMDRVQDLEKFLAIVVDSATQERVEDQRFLQADAIIKIDHHPEVDPYGDLQIVDIQRGSACEIVSDLLLDNGFEIDADNANILMSGILTDTQKFSIESVSAKTFRTAASLMDCGANVAQLNAAMFSQDAQVWTRRRRLQNEVQFTGALAYAIISQEVLKELNILDREAKMFVNMMAGIKEYNIWALFIQDEEGIYNGSLRSRTHTISDIAAEFNGGGHRLASGVKGLDEAALKEIIKKLKETSLSE